jgi:hypothetical protein
MTDKISKGEFGAWTRNASLKFDKGKDFMMSEVHGAFDSAGIDIDREKLELIAAPIIKRLEKEFARGLKKTLKKITKAQPAKTERGIRHWLKRVFKFRH